MSALGGHKNASQTQFTKLELARLAFRAEQAIAALFQNAALEAARIVSEQAIGGQITPAAKARILQRIEEEVFGPIFGRRKGGPSRLRALVQQMTAKAEALADEQVRQEIARQIRDPQERALLARAFGLPDAEA